MNNYTKFSSHLIQHLELIADSVWYECVQSLAPFNLCSCFILPLAVRFEGMKIMNMGSTAPLGEHGQ